MLEIKNYTLEYIKGKTLYIKSSNGYALPLMMEISLVLLAVMVLVNQQL